MRDLLEHAQAVAADVSEFWDEGHDVDTCEACEAGDCHKFTAGDYLADALDVEIILSGEDLCWYRAEVTTEMGGPTVWVDTARGLLFVADDPERVSVSLPDEFIEALEDAVEARYGLHLSKAAESFARGR